MKKIFSFFLALTAVMAINAATFTKVTTAPADWSGQYLIVYENSATEAYVFNGKDASQNFTTVAITDGAITSDNLSASVAQIASMEGGYSLSFEGKFLSGNATKNTISITGTPVAHSIAIVNDSVVLKSNNSPLQFNPGSTITNGVETGIRFRYYYKAKQKSIQLYKLTEGEILPPEPVQYDTISVTEARARIASNNLGACYVEGIVATFPSDPGTYGNTIFWLTDIENETDSLQGYRIAGLNNAVIADQASIPFTKGDHVLLYASSLKNYQGKYEIDGGYLAEILSSEITRQEFEYTSGVVTFDSRDGIMTIQMGEDFSAEVETSSVAAFAGTYATAMTIGDVTLPEDAKIKFTFVKVENGAHIYHVSMVYTVEETKVQYVINSDVAFTSDDTSFGTIDDGSNAPVITCAEANAWAQGKSDNTKSTVDYVVYGYFIKYGTATNNPGQYDPEKGYATFYLDDNAAAEKGAFQAYKCEPADPSYTSPAVGDIVAVRGKLQAYKNSCEIAGGKYERYTATGIEDVVAAPKATKTILNGQVVIIKNGELFNVLGTKL